jgi:hypothetical protein
MREKLGKLVIFEEESADISILMASEGDEKEKKTIDDFIGLFTNRSNLQDENQSYEESRTLILENMRWTSYFLNKLRTSLHTEIQLNNAKFR